MNVTTKGQVTIPLKLRTKYGITETTEVDFVEDQGRIYLVKLDDSSRSRSRFEKLRGISKSSMSTDEIMKLTRSEDK
jgi:AbrB family looped-hinge helix DNA binding protein